MAPRRVFLGIVSLSLLAIIAVAMQPHALALISAQSAPTQGNTPSHPSGDYLPVRVKTVRPKRGPEIEVSVSQPAEVAPYYRVDLFAESAGTVVFLEKALGEEVSAGEKLIVIKPISDPSEPLEPVVIEAPFDGVIAARSVDPGTFVPSATIVPGASPLLVIERNDIVTVSMRVPDAFVAYVDSNTQAEISLDSLPEQTLKCRLSRIAPSLSVADRTLRVEVDLFNGNREDYDELVARSQQNQAADFKGRQLPEFPQGLSAEQSPNIIPGMYGQMRLIFRRFTNIPLVPSGAIIRHGGIPYLIQVTNGQAEQKPIAIEFDDGKLAHVRWLMKEGDKTLRRELTGEEEIIWSNQGEIEVGQAVQPVLSTW